MPKTPEEQADLAKRRGEAAKHITDEKVRADFIASQGKAEQDAYPKQPSDLTYSRLESEIAPASMGKTPAGYKKGTMRVPKTGAAMLHKDEAVLPKKAADKYRDSMSLVEAALAHKAMANKEPEKPAKEIKHMNIRKGKSGGYIMEHHHTMPEAHPMEEHTAADQDGMMDHVMQHMGEPNDGETEADGGQSGMEQE